MGDILVTISFKDRPFTQCADGSACERIRLTRQMHDVIECDCVL